MYERNAFYIDGRWERPSSGQRIPVISPSSESIVGSVPEGMPADIDRAVGAARRAFDQGPWPRMLPSERAAIVDKMADYFEQKGPEITELLVDEMGAPLQFMRAAEQSSAALLRMYANLGRETPLETVREGVSGKSIVRHEAVGVVAAITPWNGPLFILLLKCAPALVAGCTIVAKPSPEAPLDAYFLAEAAEAAGLPEGVLNIVPGGRETGEHLVRHPGIDKVSFTGSTAAGRKIGAICGEHLKRCGLELGGKSAAILLEDADLSTAVPTSVHLGLAFNNGQACAALTRVLAPSHRYAEVVEAFREVVSGLVQGDPHDIATQVGPLIASRQRDRVESYIRLGLEQGARIAIGGKRPKDLKRGWFVEPTVFYDVTNQMRIAREEIFGPVGVIIPYDSEEQAISIANDSDYGLAGAVFSSDASHALSVARQMRAGTIGVNTFGVDLCCPFGGFKASGIGREMGPEGLAAFLEAKTLLGAGSLG
ncbi:MAG: aldehyde dehydrogenase [Candidatus Binatia bacterium]